MDVSRYTKKAQLYLDEARYATRVPGFSNRARLVYHTVGFHWQNLRRNPVDPSTAIDFEVPVKDAIQTVRLRPYAGDMAILYEVFARSEYDIPEEMLDPESVETVVDAGAHIGLAALYFANRYPRAQVHCLEPNPNNYALLCENTRSNPRINPINAGLTGQPSEDMYISTSGRTSHFQLNASGKGRRVPTTTIEELCEEHSIGRINLLKLDIEGGEVDVLAHPAFLSRVDAIIAELHGRYGFKEFTADVGPFGLSTKDGELPIAYRNRTAT